jgi:uncharacterized phage-like protein YoqJ
VILGITGHRDLGGCIIPNNVYNYVFGEMEKLFVKLKPDMTINGGAIGGDQLSCEVCVKLGIPYTIARPFEGQERRWSKEAQERYNDLITKAANVGIVSPGGFAIWKYQTRNEWIVDNSDMMIGIWSGIKEGGTYNCLQYAKKQKKDIIIIDPTKAGK